MPSAKTQPARGMRDFLPEDVRKREYVIGVIKDVYERYGFEPLETPAAENIETLMGKYGEEGNQLIFKILKRGVHEGTGEADLALRYDLTVPLARVVAEYRDKLPKFFKRYQIQPVWRADRPARGRFREFYQCDVDVIGSKSMLVEAELCAATSDVLEHLGFRDFTIRLNHRELLTAILEFVGIPGEAHDRTLVVLDKLDKLGKEGVEAELKGIGISNQQIMDVMIFTFEDVYAASLVVGREGESPNQTYNRELWSRLHARLDTSPRAVEALTQIKQILDFSGATSAANKVELDLSLVRGLSYYTGAIMEIKVPTLSGSLGGGGRYNNLIGMFLGNEVPACGFSLGLERILVVMTELNMFPPTVSFPAAEIMVAVTDNTRRAGIASLALANELRRCGIKTDLYPARDAKLGIQYKYGTNRGMKLAVTIADRERESDEILVRDLRTRHEITVKREDLTTTLLRLLEDIEIKN